MCSRTFSSTLATTRSGPSARIASRSGVFSPPILVFVRVTSAGSRQYTVTPTSASASPSAQRVSVVEGIKETIRRGARSEASGTPEASTSAALTRSAGSGCGRRAPGSRACARRPPRPTSRSRRAALCGRWRLRGSSPPRRTASGPVAFPRSASLRSFDARSVEAELRHVPPARLALGLEVLGGHEVHPVVEVQLELPAAVSRADPPRRVFEERCHLGRGEAHEPLEPDRAGERLLDAERRGESGPDARELLQGLSA